MMKKLQILFVFVICMSASPMAASGAGAGPADGRSGHTLIEASIRAMGGLDLLRSLGIVHTEGLEVVNQLAGHDRPGMTLYTGAFRFREWRDAKNHRRRYE